MEEPPQPHHHDHPDHPDASVVSFENGVTDIMMVTEEFKQSLPTTFETDDFTELQRELHCLESIVQRLDFLFRLTLDEPGDDVRKDLCLHCGQRAAQVSDLIFRQVTTTKRKSSSRDGGGKIIKELLDFGGDHMEEGQGAIARITELSLMIHGMMYELQNLNNSDNTNDHGHVPCPEMDQIIEAYSVYQQKLLRQRSKPAIAQLAEWRQHGKQKDAWVVPHVTAGVRLEGGGGGSSSSATPHDEHGATDAASMATQQQPHTHAITVILGQGSALLHPLLVWQQQVPPESPVYKLCQRAIAVLDDQSQTLVKTVAEWFLEDRCIDDWMVQAATAAAGDVPSPEDGTTATTTTSGGVSNGQSPPDLAELDSLVEEMSFCCQLLIRYQRLVQYVVSSAQEMQNDGNDNSGNNIPPKIVAEELVPEWTWKYAALERYLSTQQWQHAVEMACPVDIVVGMPIKVPSVVEDAQYLSTRALERASSTMSIQAMGTVAHSISHDIWSTDNDSGVGGVYQSLMQQRGCVTEQNQDSSNNHHDDSIGADMARPPQSGNSSNAFASALLDALDDDLGHTGSSAQTLSSPLPRKSPPSSLSSGSGGILGIGALANLTKGGGGQSQYQKQQNQLRLDSQLCNLNGIHSASVACTSLEKLLESHMEEALTNNNGDGNESSGATSMIELAQEELRRYSQSYEILLNTQIQQVLVDWCGSSPVRQETPKSSYHHHTKSLDVLQEFFQTEVYHLDSTQFATSETDERLDRTMIAPLRESPIVQNLNKCDDQVTTLLCRELSSMVANVVLYSLWSSSSSSSSGPSSYQQSKQFTDWGSLLLSKQIRLLQNFLCGLLAAASEESYNTASLMEQWQQLSQVSLCLGLDSVSDWYSYQSTSSLSPEELEKTFKLRVDFDPKAIAALVSKVKEESSAN